jgi:hypothetical protein
MNDSFLLIQHENEQEFERIASILLNKCAIQTHETLFRLTDIEFYWNSQNHIDHSTYKRKYVDPKNGEWFFHYSGVDIALRNDAIGGYGGILIRGIYGFDEAISKHYKGPMICAMKLFSGTDAFSHSIKTKIIDHNFEQLKIEKGSRVGLGENAIKSGTESLKYRYYIYIK